MHYLSSLLLGATLGGLIVAWIGGRFVIRQLRRELSTVAPQLDRTLRDMEQVLESARGELEPYVQEAQTEELDVSPKGD